MTHLNVAVFILFGVGLNCTESVFSDITVSTSLPCSHPRCNATRNSHAIVVGCYCPINPSSHLFCPTGCELENEWKEWFVGYRQRCFCSITVSLTNSTGIGNIDGEINPNTAATISAVFCGIIIVGILLGLMYHCKFIVRNGERVFDSWKSVRLNRRGRFERNGRTDVDHENHDQRGPDLNRYTNPPSSNPPSLRIPASTSPPYQHSNVRLDGPSHIGIDSQPPSYTIVMTEPPSYSMAVEGPPSYSSVD